MMKQMKLSLWATTAVAALALTACTSRQPGPDLVKVGERAEMAMVEYDAYLRDNNVTEPGPAEFQQFETYLSQITNADPRFYGSPIGFDVQNDGSVDGFKDSNGDGEPGGIGEYALFTIEIDSVNNRLVITEEGGVSTGFPLASAATGFLAGALIGNLLNRQRSAGIRPESFNNRNIKSTSEYRQSQAQAQNARSRARSGGPSRGK